MPLLNKIKEAGAKAVGEQGVDVDLGKINRLFDGLHLYVRAVNNIDDRRVMARERKRLEERKEDPAADDEFIGARILEALVTGGYTLETPDEGSSDYQTDKKGIVIPKRTDLTPAQLREIAYDPSYYLVRDAIIEASLRISRGAGASLEAAAKN